MKTFKEIRSIIREFSDSQIDMLARQYAGLKDKTISTDQANKLRKIFAIFTICIGIYYFFTSDSSK